MLKEAIEKIAQMASRNLEFIPTKEGRLFANHQPEEIIPHHIEGDDCLDFETLQGFIDYCKQEAEAAARIVHIISPTRVALISDLSEVYRRRETYALARYDFAGFPFATPLDHESFVIGIQTLFADGSKGKTTKKDELLKLIGNLGAEKVVNATDDGVSQTVAVKSGALLTKQAIRNPWELAPFRTFAEIDQPISPFILRVHQQGDSSVPRAALYPCDNERWKITAIERLRTHLASELGKEFRVVG